MKKPILIIALLLFVTESFVFAQTEVKIDSFEQNGKKIKTVKVTAQYNDAEKTSDKGKKFATFKVSVDKNGNNINIDSSGSIDLNDINTEDIKSIKVIKKKKSKNDNADIDIMTWDEKGEQNDDGEIEIDLKEKGKKIRLVKVETSPTVSEKIYSIGEGDNKFLKRIYITPTTKKITYIVKDKQHLNKEKEIIVYYKTPTTERRYFPSGDNDFNEFEFVVADDDNQFAPPPPPPPPPPPTSFTFKKGQFKDKNVSNYKFVKGVKTSRGFLGVIAEDDDNGAKIAQVVEKSPAAQAGLKEGDIITKINSMDVNKKNTLIKILTNFKANDTVDITYSRNSKTLKEKNVTLAQVPDDAEKNYFYSYSYNSDDNDDDVVKDEDVNIQLKKVIRNNDGAQNNFENGESFEFLNNFVDRLVSDRPKMGISVEDLEEGSGVKITEVEQNSDAAKAGLLKGDIITNFNQVAINNVSEMIKQARLIKPDMKIPVSYKRNGKDFTTTIKIKKKIEEANL